MTTPNNLTYRSILFGLITLLCAPSVYADDGDSLYKRVKDLVEREMNIEEAELVSQRFAVGVYHDHEVTTIQDGGGVGDTNVPFPILDENYVDLSIQEQYQKMCGSDVLKNDYGTCLQVQDILRRSNVRSSWLRKLGRNLQMITSGYESGIDGYPGKVINVIPRMTSITHMWRASNDQYYSPILEVLTRALPWPDGEEDNIREKSKEIIEYLKNLDRKKGDKVDDSEKVAAVWRYRHGVQQVKLEGTCASAPEFPLDPANIWLERRWCDLEDLLDELQTMLESAEAEAGNDRQAIFPSYIVKKENIVIWMRFDDVGLQWYTPLEPVQAALYHPDFGDCIEADDARNCYDTFSSFIIRGGRYPSKIGDEEVRDSETGEFEEEFTIPEPSPGSRDDDISPNSVVPEPLETFALCSHPFAKRGYLCRRVEYEACDLTKKQQEQLADTGTGGIVLTACEPERFKGETARKTSGPSICEIGGWRETVEDNLEEDTPEQQLDMKVNECSACGVDIVCKDNCFGDDPDREGFAKTSFPKRNGIIEVCIPPNPSGSGSALYLMAHELIHAQQNCRDSDLQVMDRTGIGSDNDPIACCSAEREAYFVQCKMMAQDGILDRAGVTIDQCASAYANFSCDHHDDDKDDEDYPCSNDGIDPALVAKAVNTARDEISTIRDLPSTCEAAMDDPRIKTLRNSFPFVCKPGCESKYQNTIGNNLCFTGQCIEELHEQQRQGTGRMGLTTVDEDFPWDSCQLPDPNIGRFEAPPAITAPKFPLYKPQQLLRTLDHALCQINGLPARSPPIICAFDPVKRLGLPPLNYTQSVDDLVLQPEQYEATGLGIQYAASGIGARVAGDMFTLYFESAARQYTDLLNTMFHVFERVGEIKFPTTMCSRIDGNVDCSTYQR